MQIIDNFDMNNLSGLFEKTQEKLLNPDKNVSQEFQIFGVHIAEQLNDMSHKSLYIKLAKTEPRSRLHKTLQFVLDYPNAKSKGKLFMYKLKELRKSEKL
ncbi:hypothetical protein COX05_00740 [candidate division WWE3 bacterium CG22_combo_CG10-13_8_21_14_all_39_12]|uniref:Uncharacterized protein n=2 Tax=Katanobacteria TaxID=422282 RepID=A0A2M7X0C6_UNCKA|nr:MAG: hypothetical protein COX05_00740 [candidate division WWE3 bacterium CG22_combo_CG10-13_8_21_14_all_39_12]PJA39522.1 MAG: hypothetical protein CO179_05020 [candidate division WWE3 bacterium CG_4_9_14_3_um_filter_39_7]